ncbi:MAG: glycine betaine ABC transporter substrate-binding protein, partial [Bacillota bacterium]|nr:glycine betaine ABC transporter substrate-binding protein [Bacillota bacterium]
TASKGTVRLLYVEWACARASTHVMADILENIMGYDVEITSVAAGAMYEGLASNEGDAMFTAWLPVTHADYVEQVGDKIEDLGPNNDSARIGLVVPAYVDIDSIEDLNANKDKFGGEIIGIDPGAGLMKASVSALDEYALDLDLVEGTDATMVASLKNAIDNEEWVVVTGWTPHWKFARWDLKFLDDPKTIYGETETINTMVRLGLKEDMPEVYELCDNFHWTSEQIGSAMALAEEMDSVAAARQWVEENQDVVNSWLPAPYKK